MASDLATRAASKDGARTITVVVRRLREGVWLATSDDLPGLIVETETREEAIDLSPELALELLNENGERSDGARPRFVFAFIKPASPRSRHGLDVYRELVRSERAFALQLLGTISFRLVIGLNQI